MLEAKSASMWKSRYDITADGRQLATRVSMWRQEEELRSEGQRVGSVRRKSIWRGDPVAELPGIPRPVEVFVLGVVLTMWDLAAASAATAG